MLVSTRGTESLKDIAITKAFMSAAGINERLGVTCINSYEVPYKKMVMVRALEKYLVVDSSKFGVIKMYSVAGLKEFDAVITDKNLPEKWMKYIKDLGVKLYLC